LCTEGKNNSRINGLKGRLNCCAEGIMRKKTAGKEEKRQAAAFSCGKGGADLPHAPIKRKEPAELLL